MPKPRFNAASNPAQKALAGATHQHLQFATAVTFCGMVQLTDGGLRPVGGFLLIPTPSTSVRLRLLIARHLRAGVFRTSHPARVVLRGFFLLTLLGPPRFGGFLGYRGSLFRREFFGAGFAPLLTTKLAKSYRCRILFLAHIVIIT